MPGKLSKAGEAAAKLAAQKLREKYKNQLKALALKAIKGTNQAEIKALGFFKGRDRTSHYQPKAFADARRGCQTAKIWIHPHIEWKDVELGGSKTLSNVPQALTDIGPVFPGERFISGHMINADFGGDHTDPGNQTVLTHAANSQHDFDDAVKSAAKKMGIAVYEMYRASNAPAAETYLDGVYDNWVIKVSAAVGAESWYDIYNADPVLKTNSNVTSKYPLDAVATQIVFTAQAASTPTATDIAKNLLIPEGKMGPIATALAEFSQFMDEAASFELNQAAPPGFGTTDRSPVTTTMNPLTGPPVSKASTTNPYKAKAKKGTPKPPKPVVAIVPCYLTLAGGTKKIALKAGGDNEIGCASKGYPWAAAKNTDLEDDLIFYITTQPSGGEAIVSLEPGVDAEIEVNGTTLKKAKLPLNDGETLLVYDSHAPGGSYEFTFEQH